MLKISQLVLSSREANTVSFLLGEAQDSTAVPAAPQAVLRKVPELFLPICIFYAICVQFELQVVKKRLFEAGPDGCLLGESFQLTWIPLAHYKPGEAGNFGLVFSACRTLLLFGVLLEELVEFQLLCLGHMKHAIDVRVVMECIVLALLCRDCLMIQSQQVDWLQCKLLSSHQTRATFRKSPQ